MLIKSLVIILDISPRSCNNGSTYVRVHSNYCLPYTVETWKYLDRMQRTILMWWTYIPTFKLAHLNKGSSVTVIYRNVIYQNIQKNIRFTVQQGHSKVKRDDS